MGIPHELQKLWLTSNIAKNWKKITDISLALGGFDFFSPLLSPIGLDLIRTTPSLFFDVFLASNQIQGYTIKKGW